MNDLHFIFYDPKVMFLDTSDMTCEGERAHRRLCDFVWFMDAVPMHDDEKLKQISHTKSSDWGRVKGELKYKGWFDFGGFFIHKGAVGRLNKSKEKYVENYNRQTRMNKLKPLVLSLPDIVTGIVTYTVTMDVTPDVTLGVTGIVDVLQSESESEKNYKASTKRFSRLQVELTARMEFCLKKEWENDRQKWMGRIKNKTSKMERVCAEVESAIKESRVKKTPASYAEQIWKEFE